MDKKDYIFYSVQLITIPCHLFFRVCFYLAGATLITRSQPNKNENNLFKYIAPASAATKYGCVTRGQGRPNNPHMSSGVTELPASSSRFSTPSHFRSPVFNNWNLKLQSNWLNAAQPGNFEPGVLSFSKICRPSGKRGNAKIRKV